MQSRFGEGTVVVAAFPANREWTNLPFRRGAFVPLVLGLIWYTQHQPDVEGPSVVPADALADFKVKGTWSPVSGKVTDAAGHSVPLDFDRKGSWMTGVFERTATRGYYTVEISGGRPDQRRDASFAVNLAPEESDFTTYNEDQFREMLPGTKLTLVDASAQAQQDLGAIGESPSEVWRWLIYVVFVVIAVEFMLATFGGSNRANEENLTISERLRRYSPGSWVGRMTGAGMKGS